MLCRRHLRFLVLAATFSRLCIAEEAVWKGGEEGVWHDASNWIDAEVPCNVGDKTFRAKVLTGHASIEQDCAVSNLELSNAHVTLLEGTSLGSDGITIRTNGFLTVTDGTTLTGETVKIGLGLGGLGTLDIDGGATDLAEVSLGNSARGVLNVTDGGNVRIRTADVGTRLSGVVGRPSGSGEIHVLGPRSRMEIDELNIGKDINHGTVSIKGGGSITANQARFLGVDGSQVRLVIGLGSDSQPNVFTVHDASVFGVLELERDSMDNVLQIGQEYDIILAQDSLSGHFSKVEGIGIDETTGLAVTYQPNAVTARVTIFGDINFDDVFNSSDLVGIFQAGEYEDDTRRNSTWVDGDWNGNGDFDASDLVVAFQAGTYVGDDVVSIVPEPSSIVPLVLAMFLMAVFSRHRPIRSVMFDSRIVNSESRDGVLPKHARGRSRSKCEACQPNAGEWHRWWLVTASPVLGQVMVWPAH